MGGAPQQPPLLPGRTEEEALPAKGGAGTQRQTNGCRQSLRSFSRSRGGRARARPDWPQKAVPHFEEYPVPDGKREFTGRCQA